MTGRGIKTRGGGGGGGAARLPSDNETETFIVNDCRWHWMFLERTRLLLTAPTQGRGIGGPPVLLSAPPFMSFDVKTREESSKPELT